MSLEYPEDEYLTLDGDLVYRCDIRGVQINNLDPYDLSTRHIAKPRDNIRVVLWNGKEYKVKYGNLDSQTQFWIDAILLP